MAKTFQELIVWQKSHQLVLLIYRYTKGYPSEEKFGLVSQMRRASVSVPSNIVEGFKRRGYKDALNFFNIAHASLEELIYQTILSFDLHYLTLQEYNELSNQEKETEMLLDSWKKSYYKNTSIQRT